ncbi:unnamed protein product [Natator depressus]
MGLFRFRRQLIKGRYDKGIREGEWHGGDELGGPVRSIPPEQRSVGVTAKPHGAAEGMALSQPGCGMPGNPASPPETKNVAGFQGRPLAGRTRQCGGGGESPAGHSQGEPEKSLPTNQRLPQPAGAGLAPPRRAGHLSMSRGWLPGDWHWLKHLVPARGPRTSWPRDLSLGGEPEVARSDASKEAAPGTSVSPLSRPPARPWGCRRAPHPCRRRRFPPPLQLPGRPLLFARHRAPASQGPPPAPPPGASPSAPPGPRRAHLAGGGAARGQGARGAFPPRLAPEPDATRCRSRQLPVQVTTYVGGLYSDGI